MVKFLISTCVFFGILYLGWTFVPGYALSGFIVPKTHLFLTYGTLCAAIGAAVTFKKVK